MTVSIINSLNTILDMIPNNKCKTAKLFLVKSITLSTSPGIMDFLNNSILNGDTARSFYSRLLNQVYPMIYKTLELLIEYIARNR